MLLEENITVATNALEKKKVVQRKKKTEDYGHRLGQQAVECINTGTYSKIRIGELKIYSLLYE